ncbi:MAG: DNA repair protein RecO [Verrucomicrobiota bacterium JB023]|nr:DNA repair protein RecO [Verrucomicrobiota bacterium JB023]
METANGIIIRIRKLTESSLIVTWCTEEWGVLKTVAKGARGPKSLFSGKLDLFVSAEIGWVRSRQSELHTLREMVVGSYRESLRGDYSRTVMAAYFGELVERAVEGESAIPKEHDLLKRALDFLAGGGEVERAFPFFEKELARILGVGDGRQGSLQLAEALNGGFPRSRREAARLAG